MNQSAVGSQQSVVGSGQQLVVNLPESGLIKNNQKKIDNN